MRGCDGLSYSGSSRDRGGAGCPPRVGRGRSAARRARRGVAARRRPQRRGGLRRPTCDARSARGRHRPGPCEQGEPRRRRQPCAGRLEAGRRTAPTRRQRALGVVPVPRGGSSAAVHSLVLTASGGPFRGRSREELTDVTAEEALAHPTWSMGPKITIDSATLMNKGLEADRSAFLCSTSPTTGSKSLSNPSSIVHSLVRSSVDGAVLAHLGILQMRVPISYALTYPERAETPIRAA